MVIAIIADDLTGACDTGAQLASTGLRTIACITHEFSADEIPQVLIANTQSRGMEPLAASKSVQQAAMRLKRMKPKWFFKKIDTALRGNIATEILSMMDTLGIGTALFVGAIPQAGRTTIGGCQFLHGIPITDSILGRDELNPNPVLTSRIADLFLKEPDTEVEVVDLDQIRSGRLDIDPSQKSKAKKIVIFDGETDEDIDRIVKGSMKLDTSSFLYVGALGLAGGLGGYLAPSIFPPWGREQTENLLEEIRARRILIVSGSPHPATQEQISHLRERNLAKVVEIEPDDLLQNLDNSTAETGRQCQAGLNELGRVLIYIGWTKPRKELEGRTLVVALAQLVRDLLASNEVDGLMLVGGETAFAICQAIGIKTIEICGTISAVAAYGKPQGAPKNINVMVTKGGSLGERDILEKVLNFISQT